MHAKYLAGQHRQAGRVAAPEGEQTYTVLSGDALSSGYAGREALAVWIDAAASYAGREKGFVDTLVGLNGTVIDLETALPADSAPGREAAAPRMDLVVLQAGSAGPEAAFWEAKCIDNSELRAAAFMEDWDGEPEAGRAKIFSQLLRYRRWLEKPGRKAEVRTGFEATLRSLAALRDSLVTTAGIAVPDLAPAVRSSIGSGLGLVERPGIVIAADEEYGGAAKLASFEAEKPYGHRKRLEGDDYRVEVVAPRRGNGILPPLP